MTAQLVDRLSERRRLIVIGEAQNLNRDCFEYLRHLHDDPATRIDRTIAHSAITQLGSGG